MAASRPHLLLLPAHVQAVIRRPVPAELVRQGREGKPLQGPSFHAETEARLPRQHLAAAGKGEGEFPPLPRLQPHPLPLQDGPGVKVLHVERYLGRAAISRQAHRPPQGLPRVEDGGKCRVIAAVGEFLRPVIGGLVQVQPVPRLQARRRHLQAALPGKAVLRRVLHAGHPPVQNLPLRRLHPQPHGVGGTGKFKMVPSLPVQYLPPALRDLLPVQPVGQPGDVGGGAGDILDVIAPQHPGTDEEIVHRPPPFLPDGGKAQGCSQDAGHISHVAVRVPAAEIADLQCPVKIPRPVEHGQGHHRRVGDDVADSGIAVVSVVLPDKVEAVPPGLPLLLVAVVVIHHRPHRLLIGAARLHEGEARLHHPADIPLAEGGADAGGHKGRPV